MSEDGQCITLLKPYRIVKPYQKLRQKLDIILVGSNLYFYICIYAALPQYN